jgi:hypothetical protein
LARQAPQLYHRYVSQDEAEGKAKPVDYLLTRLKQRLIQGAGVAQDQKAIRQYPRLDRLAEFVAAVVDGVDQRLLQGRGRRM